MAMSPPSHQLGLCTERPSSLGCTVPGIHDRHLGAPFFSSFPSLFPLCFLSLAQRNASAARNKTETETETETSQNGALVLALTLPLALAVALAHRGESGCVRAVWQHDRIDLVRNITETETETETEPEPDRQRKRNGGVAHRSESERARAVGQHDRVILDVLGPPLPGDLRGA